MIFANKTERNIEYILDFILLTITRIRPTPPYSLLL